MLVFTRKRHEAIVIGDDVEVRVLRIGRDGVRLGVSAPMSVAVHRREVYEQICLENRNAARAATAVHLLAARLRRVVGSNRGQRGSGDASGAPPSRRARRRPGAGS